ncbi:hypothetical protein CS063_01435 [Sporanaerobium hydrogeniformans]|uniref:Uncharacterized protein n=2 Tax=Sporanaerobium hydrogeniformans TaxID=3072179 RepID=A0AC61DFV1_9FIRM|nr:hypothetical protein [Sporanaerobium hydrogeniformans]PHV69178.1 hypothetical protein CS063_17300 [Sporanaerobium hydrogeniformans]PHV72165.1 hypothetical protein CS063_01435 [Sporanaerobium hydrogeniformans]
MNRQLSLLESKPKLWKYDNELGVAYFCPHCKTFICDSHPICKHCGFEVDWNKEQEFKGKVKW